MGDVTITLVVVMQKFGFHPTQHPLTKANSHPNQIINWKAQLEGGDADVFGASNGGATMVISSACHFFWTALPRDWRAAMIEVVAD